MPPTAHSLGSHPAADYTKEDLPSENPAVSCDLRLPSGDVISSGELPSQAQQRQPTANNLNDPLGEVLQQGPGSTEMVEAKMGAWHACDALEVATTRPDAATTRCGPAQPEWNERSTGEMLPAIPAASEASTVAVEAKVAAASIATKPLAGIWGTIKTLAASVASVQTAAAELGG